MKQHLSVMISRRNFDYRFEELKTKFSKNLEFNNSKLDMFPNHFACIFGRYKDTFTKKDRTMH